MTDDYKKHLETMVNTESGKHVLAYWKEEFRGKSLIGDSPELTYYNLGKKEFVEAVMDSLKDEDSLDDIKLIYNQEEE